MEKSSDNLTIAPTRLELRMGANKFVTSRDSSNSNFWILRVSDSIQVHYQQKDNSLVICRVENENWNPKDEETAKVLKAKGVAMLLRGLSELTKNALVISPTLFKSPLIAHALRANGEDSAQSP
jgi:hypothetical protein